MAGHFSFLFGAIALLARCQADAQTTSAPPSSSLTSDPAITPIPAHVYHPLIVTGQFPWHVQNTI